MSYFCLIKVLKYLQRKKKLLYIYTHTYIYISALKRSIAINRIQNKSFSLHNICMHAVYIYYVYINTHVYMFQKNILCLCFKYIYL